MSLYVKQALYTGSNGMGHPRPSVGIQVVINVHVVRRGKWGPILAKDARVDTVWRSDNVLNICIWGSREGNQQNPLGRGGIKIWIRKMAVARQVRAPAIGSKFGGLVLLSKIAAVGTQR